MLPALATPAWAATKVPAGHVLQLEYTFYGESEGTVELVFSYATDYCARVYYYDNNDWLLASEKCGSGGGTASVTLSFPGTNKISIVIIVTAPAQLPPELEFSVQSITININNAYYESGRTEYENLSTISEENGPAGMLARLIQAIANIFRKAANFILSLLPDWLRGILESSWNIIKSFAGPLFDILSRIFEIYPLVFMLISLKYILSGDMEGWLDYLFMHVKVIKVFIDLGLKLIELIKP